MAFHFPTDTLGFQLEKAGFLSAAPYLAMGILLSISGYFADMCQVRGYLTTTQVRRYFNCGGFLSQTVFMMAAAYIQSPTGSIICIITAVGLGAFAWCGFSYVLIQFVFFLFMNARDKNYSDYFSQCESLRHWTTTCICIDGNFKYIRYNPRHR